MKKKINNRPTLPRTGFQGMVWCPVFLVWAEFCHLVKFLFCLEKGKQVFGFFVPIS
jgi:hypothetical protein